MPRRVPVLRPAPDAEEEWRALAKCQGYLFSSYGRAARLLRNGKLRLLSGCLCGAGYRAISCAVGDGIYQRVYIHRGVLEVFSGACPKGMEARHLNGDKLDNRLCNLAWGTPAENAYDKVAHGTVSKGERNGISKLTYNLVLEMRGNRASFGASYAALAKLYGVSTMTAFRAIKGESWN